VDQVNLTEELVSITYHTTSTSSPYIAVVVMQKEGNTGKYSNVLFESR